MGGIIEFVQGLWALFLLLLQFLVDLVRFPVCYIAQFFLEMPQFLNDITVAIGNAIIAVLPVTPDDLKIGLLLSNYSTQNPLGYWFFSYFSSGIFAVIGIYLGVKIVKILIP